MRIGTGAKLSGVCSDILRTLLFGRGADAD
jgi:hypothetical protein